MKKHLCLKEYESSEEVSLSDEQLASLASFKTQIQIQGTSRAGEYKIQADSWVGDILAPGILISIEPKFGSADLLRLLLLGDAEAIPRWVQSILTSKDTLWDLMAELLISEVQKISTLGLAKNYIELEANVTSPIGQVLFFRDFTENTPIRKGISCRFDDFSEDIPKNRALKWALESLASLVSRDKQQEVLRTLGSLASVTPLNEPPDFRLPPREDPYRFPLFLVELLKRFSSVGSGQFGFRGNGYLLNMNDVFEGFVRNQLRRSISSLGINVVQKGRNNRSLCDGVGLEPDIVLCKRNLEIVAVADCKYKRDWNKINSDVYQMLAYLEGYHPVKIAIVFYPSSESCVSINSVSLPRDRTLFSVGLPERKLLDEAVWVEVCRVISGFFDNNATIAEVS